MIKRYNKSLYYFRFNNINYFFNSNDKIIKSYKKVIEHMYQTGSPGLLILEYHKYTYKLLIGYDECFFIFNDTYIVRNEINTIEFLRDFISCLDNKILLSLKRYSYIEKISKNCDVVSDTLAQLENNDDFVIYDYLDNKSSTYRCIFNDYSLLIIVNDKVELEKLKINKSELIRIYKNYIVN